MKLKKILGALLLSVAMFFGFSACKDKTQTNPNPEKPEEKVVIEAIFNSDGGSAVDKVTLTEAGIVSQPKEPTKEGYVFEGWYKDSAKTTLWDFSKDVVSKSTTIYAKWAKIVTCAEATKLCEPEGYSSTERFYIRGTVDKISNPTYGEMTISDETGSLYVYGTYSSDGKLRYSELEEKPYAGDEVFLSGLLKNFKGQAELSSAWIIEFKHVEEEFDESDYTKMTIAEARTAAKDAKIILEGVVAKITYANGMIPSGFYLVDSTSSIYVYDSQITPRVEVGNKVKVAGVKDLWILDTEVGNASKFGYEGCCQLSNAHLLENDEKKNSYDKSWIEKTTIKAIMDTPVSENITTLIYKVDALVKKAEGTGFVNYYFNDIDGVTGSYTYTQCNGSDFSWLDEFDGKICTVYLSAINAKSSASGCSWRFFPIEVIDESYTFNIADAPKFAINYYGVGQFDKSYTGDPNKELITSVSQDIIGVKDIKLEYTSNDTNVISFDVEEDKLIMHTHEEGNAKVTIKASYLTYEYSITIDIEHKSISLPDTITVKEAIDANPLDDGTEVIVRGIVGPSLVNRVGFYLIDETGVIAVTTDTNTLASLALGNEVILKGTRTLFGHEGNYYGQSVLLDCELIMNFYGNHDYSTKTFDNTKTLEDLIAMDVSEDHTTQVYVIEVKVKLVETQYYSNIYINSPTTDKQIILYCSSANQYNWLKKYAGENGELGETITIEIALCNWNKKSPFRGCVLAVSGENGEKEVNTLNFSK
ncbi:MAG: InlB B-repeat-containing protein [Roseburia sp.]|nr:InlB B-repeat-containing protein [Anaeroplasma bactoclasticum]MCM1197053.1 InlB B-repeat-containing protein [Roseburia sp.]MCM1557701.1 InlB B-repeat-containing protein [Anaeroplasma bactoclasticum]